jgi:hypothetical protein
MKYALLIVEIPMHEPGRLAGDMNNFLREIQSHTAKTGITGMLNVGAFLIDLKNGLHELNALVAAAEEYKYATRTLFFDQVPPFVISKALPP